MLPADTRTLFNAVVSEVPLGVLMSDEHPLASRDDLDWRDLGGQDLLWFERSLAPGYHDETALGLCQSGMATTAGL